MSRHLDIDEHDGTTLDRTKHIAIKFLYDEKGLEIYWTTKMQSISQLANRVVAAEQMQAALCQREDVDFWQSWIQEDPVQGEESEEEEEEEEEEGEEEPGIEKEEEEEEDDRECEEEEEEEDEDDEDKSKCEDMDGMETQVSRARQHTG